MDPQLREVMEEIANTVRGLSMDAVEKAKSGHPGLPMGCAEFGAYLYGHAMRHNPKNPNWFNRDRFVLSAGHGSMWLYALLHLSGFPVSLEDIKKFRQLNSVTPGHPERLDTEGVEVTTGPLGQGTANAVGMALAAKLLAHKFNRDNYKIVDNTIWCLAGDGCLMEGIGHEASALASHLKLDNLVLVHDRNFITLDGPYSQSGSEDIALRYKAYGWDVVNIEDGNSTQEIFEALENIKTGKGKPIFVILHTVIGKGAPTKSGTHLSHGSPLGPEEIENAKKNLGLPEEPFYVPASVKEFFAQRLERDQADEEAWNKEFEEWGVKYPDLKKEFLAMQSNDVPESLEKELAELEVEYPIAGRKMSQACLQVIGKHLPQLYGGSADLSGSDATMMKEYPLVYPGDFSGRNIKYGIREFGMAAIANGLSAYGLITPYVGTFLTFSDYMRNAIRLAALSHHRVIYQFTHDSIFLGEDGPTHQPVEQVASLRAMPELYVFRPADMHEVAGAWTFMLKREGPSAIILTRQSLPAIEGTEKPFSETTHRGAYIIKEETKGKPIDFALFATGSELSLALDVAKKLSTLGKNVRVVSFVCWELFEKQDGEYREWVIGGDLGTRVSIEAGVTFGWNRYTGPNGIQIGIDEFGRSAPLADIQDFFGFTVDHILERLLTPVKETP